jgi:hypothetical protein
MPPIVIAAGIAAAGAVGGGVISAVASGKAADKQVAASKEVQTLAEKQYQEQKANLSPYRATGEQANQQLADVMKPGSTSFQSDPGYAFRLAEGQKALERSAASKTGTLSGAATKSAQRYGQDYAASEYQNVFNRYQSVANMGMNAAAGTNVAGQNYVDNATNAITGGANASAAGTIGGANAINSALGGVANAAELYALGSIMQPGNLSGYGKTPPLYDQTGFMKR